MYYAIFENGISVIVFNWFKWYALRFKLISKLVCTIFATTAITDKSYPKIKHTIFEINLKRKAYHLNQLKTITLIPFSKIA